MQPICSKETEEALLGALMIDPSALYRVAVDPFDFHFAQNRKVYVAIHELMRKHGSVDQVLLSKQLNGVDQGWFWGLINVVPSALHIEAYASEVRELAERREMLDIAGDIAKSAYAGRVDLSHFNKRLADSVRADGETRGVSTKEYYDYLVERDRKPDEVWGIPAPWGDFNKVTGGLHKRRSTLFIGQPGVGKTVAVMQIGLIAAQKGHKVSVYSLEMSERDLVGRWVAMMTRIPEKRVHRGILKPGQIVKIEQALEEIEALPIRISEETHWTSMGINADLVKHGGSDLVIVDYLAKLKDPGEKRYNAEAQASSNLRDGAKNLGHALIMVASMVKDGSVKGAAEVAYVQDETWRIEKSAFDGGVDDRIVKMFPSKQRHGGDKAYIKLEMVKDLPLLESFRSM